MLKVINLFGLGGEFYIDFIKQSKCSTHKESKFVSIFF